MAQPFKANHHDIIDAWTRQQVELKGKLITEDDVSFRLPFHPERHGTQLLSLVGGVDISFYPDPAPGDAEFEPHGNTSSDRPQVEEASCCSLEDDSPLYQRGVAALVVLSYPDLVPVYEDYEPLDLEVPYISGFLAFREVPAFERLLTRAASSEMCPQVVLVDGCGVLHPQGFGAACHLGVSTGVPTIGIAKKLLEVEGLDRAAVRRAFESVESAESGGDGSAAQTGATGSSSGGATCINGANTTPAHVHAPCAADACASNEQHTVHVHDHAGDGSTPGYGAQGHAPGTQTAGARTADGAPTAAARHGSAQAWGVAADAVAQGTCFQGMCVPLSGSSGRLLGAALRPGHIVNPIFISVGHRVGLNTAVQLTWSCCRHRVPEPTRQADIKSREYIRKQLQQQQPQHPKQGRTQ